MNRENDESICVATAKSVSNQPQIDIHCQCQHSSFIQSELRLLTAAMLWVLLCRAVPIEAMEIIFFNEPIWTKPVTDKL